MAQMIEWLSSKCKVLYSNPIVKKKMCGTLDVKGKDKKFSSDCSYFPH
jgi:hypothetical protein